MQRNRLLQSLWAILGVSLALSAARAFAATPSFTITATNVTMSSAASSGTGSTTFTLTSVNGYAGNVGIICSSPTVPSGVSVPLCNLGGPAIVNEEALTANQVATGIVAFLNSHPPCDGPCPVNLPQRKNHGLAPGLALAGALLIGFRFRRRARRWLTLTLLAVGALIGLAGIGACANNNAVTPGTYTYTIEAEDMSTYAYVTTSVNVTVP